MFQWIMESLNYIEKDAWMAFWIWLTEPKECLSFIGKNDFASISILIYPKVVTITYKNKKKYSVTDTHTVMTSHRDAIMSLYEKIKKWSISTQTESETK